MDYEERKAAERRIKRAVREAERRLVELNDAVNDALRAGRELGISWRELGEMAGLSHMTAKERVAKAEERKKAAGE